ncbi:alpha/beta hydrolase [Streptomyces sp. NBC_00237]|uniref:alpha/beta fold hydrolase n=1 Tax=Streptomyces sp. NBC_00237 TaxID=2975687 RepID=UPI002258FC28|nr:alpha/beta hydrolase [Streptomyces sp. NBC_00237]MCX5207178.1 alpha/beta hydrolase [Streptomyces sp. NBC_00237]
MPTFTAPDGTHLAYHLTGTGEPLLCLPGGAMRASEYLGDLGGLSAHRQLVLLDLRGTGASGTPADEDSYRCARQVADVEALRVHLGLDRVDVLAHSAGGNLGILYAAAHPDRVRSLALITPTAWEAGVLIAPEDRLAAARLRAGETWFTEAYAAYEARLAGQGTEVSVDPFFYGRWDDAARAHAAADADQRNPAAAARYIDPQHVDGPAVRKALAALEAPVLVLAGELDGAPDPVKAAEIAALFRHGEVAVQAGGGHFPWLDDPRGFVRTVAAFLDPAVHGVRLAGGNRIAYRVWGDPAAPPVVLLHGRSMNSADWTGIAEDLSATRRVYALDTRGHGLSDWPGDYAYPRLALDVGEVMDALGLDRIDLVGHSMGGAIALQVAQARPEQIARLVLEDALPPFPIVPPRPAEPRPPQEETDALAFDWDVVPATDEGANHPDPEWEAGLAKITAPVLVIWGGEASFLPGAGQRELAELIPGARRVTIPVGHLIHRNDPTGFLAELRGFGIY